MLFSQRLKQARKSKLGCNKIGHTSSRVGLGESIGKLDAPRFEPQALHTEGERRGARTFAYQKSGAAQSTILRGRFWPSWLAVALSNVSNFHLQ